MHLDMKKEVARTVVSPGSCPGSGMLIGLSKVFFELGDYYRSFTLVLKNTNGIWKGRRRSL
jgi:hypothetical protein